MRVVGVGKFIRNMPEYIFGAIRQRQKILVTRKGRPYFVVTPFQKLDLYNKREAIKALSISKKRELLKKKIVEKVTHKVLKKLTSKFRY
jgi:hypothetical protein